MNFRKFFGLGGNPPQTGIHAVTFTNFGWNKRQANAAEIVWDNPEYPAVLSVNYFELPPDMPYEGSVDELRHFYRARTADNGMGIIRVDTIEVQGVRCALTIFKLQREPSGVHYIGALTIPFEDRSYVIKLQAIEPGPTGAREAFIVDLLMKDDTFTLDNWSADPYDSNIKEGFLMNLAEDEKYDAQFSYHPLSVVRKGLDEVISSIRLSDTLLQR